jgi:hypothetical protein
MRIYIRHIPESFEPNHPHRGAKPLRRWLPQYANGLTKRAHLRRSCFICHSRGPCKHREIEVELAYMEKYSAKVIDNPSSGTPE